MKSPLRILLTGGGSGGHVYPLLAVAQKLKRLAINDGVELELYYLGPADDYASALADADVTIKSIITGKIRRYFSLQNIFDIPKFFVGLCQAFAKLYFLMPDAIFSKGGTGGLPVVLAGWFYRIPIVIHDSDTVPGTTNLVSARFSRKIAVSFESSLKYFDPNKAAWVGAPLREELFSDVPTKEEAKAEMDFDEKEPLILIFGGSQGSQRINEFIVENLRELLKETQVLHQTGRANFLDVKKLARAALIDISVKTETQHRYQAVPYLEDNLKTALSAADLIVGRPGSDSIFEISAFGKPAILIPISESANDHQRANAYEFAKTGAAVVIEEKNLLPKIFLNQVSRILKNPEILTKMSESSAKFFKPGAAEAIAQEILKIA